MCPSISFATQKPVADQLGLVMTETVHLSTTAGSKPTHWPLAYQPSTPSVLWSSPYLRCQQTLQPLGELCGLEVVVDSRLEEESPLEKSLAILDDAPDNAVLCSHGDVIPDAVNGLIRRGMDVADIPRALKKGSVFVLHRENGLFVRAEYWEAPKTK
jgi:broad specificity phosphatase PhoE